MNSRNLILTVLITVLTFLLAGTLYWGITSNRKVDSVQAQTEKEKTELEETLTDKINELKEKTDMIDGIENGDKVFAIFVVENEIYEVQVVDKNTTASAVETPVIPNSSRQFQGWSNNGMRYDETSLQLSHDFIFYADFCEVYTVTFMRGNTQLMQYQVLGGTMINDIPDTTQNGRTFAFWSTDMIMLSPVYPQGEPIWGNRTYYACYFETVDSTLYTCNYVDGRLDINGIGATTFSDYTMNNNINYVQYNFYLEGNDEMGNPMRFDNCILGLSRDGIVNSTWATNASNIPDGMNTLPFCSSFNVQQPGWSITNIVLNSIQFAVL